MLGAVLFAHQEMQIVIDKIREFASEIAKPAWEWLNLLLMKDYRKRWSCNRG